MNPFPPLIVGVMRWGKWGAQLDTKGYASRIAHCLDLGLNFFDHADIYGGYTTEAEFGKALKQNKKLANKVQIITKYGIREPSAHLPDRRIKSYDASAEHLVRSVDHSLTNLGIEQLHTLLIHRPDYLLEPEAVALALTKLKQQGKVKYFGVSNFSFSQFETLYAFIPLITNQIQLSLTHRAALDDGTLDQACRHDLPPMVWSPLGTYFQEPHQRLKTAVSEMSNKYNATEDQVLLAWVCRHPSHPLPVIGTSRMDRISSAFEAKHLRLSAEDWYFLLEAAVGRQVA